MYDPVNGTTITNDGAPMSERAPTGAVPLADAIAALRSELTRAWWDAQNKELRFKVAPVEVTLETAVTWTAEGTAGVKWWLIELGAGVTRESVTTQKIKLTLEPAVLGPDGGVRSILIDAADEGHPGRWSEEPAGLDASE